MTLAILLCCAAVVLPSGSVLAADYWSITIPAGAGSDGSNEFLEFGTKSGATNGFDGGGIDVPSPPAGPGTGFSASFHIADPFFSRLNADYREKLSDAPGSSIVWTLNVQSTSQPIILNWSAPSDAGVPTGMFLTLSSGGQTIDMRSVTSATFPGGTHTITLTAAWQATPTPTPTPTPPATDSIDDDDSDVEGTPDSTTDDTALDGDSTVPVGAGETLTPLEGTLAFTHFDIAPDQVLPNQEVVVSATICNSGDEASATTLSLMVNGVAEQSQSVGVSGGACEQIAFIITRADPGTYQVAIDGMTGQFEVHSSGTEASTGTASPGAGLDTTAIVVFAGVIAILLTAIIVVLRRR
jgi:hypothetical protein